MVERVGVREGPQAEPVQSRTTNGQYPGGRGLRELRELTRTGQGQRNGAPKEHSTLSFQHGSRGRGMGRDLNRR
jgi:hypothetical protein